MPCTLYCTLEGILEFSIWAEAGQAEVCVFGWLPTGQSHLFMLSDKLFILPMVVPLSTKACDMTLVDKVLDSPL